MHSHSLEIACPHCWEPIAVERPDYCEQEVAYTVDCEVCCRPIRLVVAWFDESEEPHVAAEPES